MHRSWWIGAMGALGFWTSATAGPDTATLEWEIPYATGAAMGVRASANTCEPSRCVLDVYSADKVNALIREVQQARERDKVAILEAVPAAPETSTVSLRREIDSLRSEVQALRQALSEAQRAMMARAAGNR